MLFLTIKLPNWKTRLLPIAAAVLAVLVLLFAVILRPRGDKAFAPQADIPSLCLDCLEGFGWEAEEPAISVENCVLSPDLSRDYLAMQTQAGFDLSDKLGSEVTRYTFRVLNYPTGDTDVLADLLVQDGVIVGGDIRSAGLDGFIHSLALEDN